MDPEKKYFEILEHFDESSSIFVPYYSLSDEILDELNEFLEEWSDDLSFEVVCQDLTEKEVDFLVSRNKLNNRRCKDKFYKLDEILTEEKLRKFLDKVKEDYYFFDWSYGVSFNV